MPFSRLSIQWKITLLAGLCLLLSGTTYFINRPPRQKPVEQ